MPRTFTRKTIAPGVTREGDALIAVVRYGSGDRQRRARRRFPLGTDLKRVIQVWQRDALNDLVTSAPASTVAGSLAADIDTFVEQLPAGTYRNDSKHLLAAWAATPIGAMSRDEITSTDLTTQINGWIGARVAPGTIRRRAFRLRALFHHFDGPTTPNPTDKLPLPKDRKATARDIPIRIVRLILDQLSDTGRAERGAARPDVSLTKIRLTVMAYSGMPPATIRRITTRDLDLDHTPGRVRLSFREKGAGVDEIWIGLIPAAVDALRAFVAAGQIGKPWARSSMWKSWQIAVRKARERARELAESTGDRSWLTEIDALPPRPRPYDLRHSFAAEIYRQTGDIRAVKELLQHADLKTTERYTKGAVSARVTAAIAVAASAFDVTTPTPAAGLRLVKPA